MTSLAVGVTIDRAWRLSVTMPPPAGSRPGAQPPGTGQDAMTLDAPPGGIMNIAPSPAAPVPGLPG